MPTRSRGARSHSHRRDRPFDYEQTPPVQVPRPPLHKVPSWTLGNWHPAAASHRFCVHSFPSTQTSGVPIRQTPATHTSSPLHAFPSAHDVLSATLVYEHTPVATSHASTVQALPSSQSAVAPHCRENGSAVSEVRSRTPPTRSGSGTLLKSMPFAMFRSPSKNHTPTGMSDMVPPRIVLRSPSLKTPDTLDTSIRVPSARFFWPMKTMPSDRMSPSWLSSTRVPSPTSNTPVWTFVMEARRIRALCAPKSSTPVAVFPATAVWKS